MFTWVIEKLEKCFPLMPELTRAEVEARGEEWLPAEIYYFVDDPSPRLKQRLWAICRLSRREVSFWRRRQAALATRWRLMGWSWLLDHIFGE